jgi:5-methylcytosine-specific restriction endonuclease McrA
MLSVPCCICGDAVLRRQSYVVAHRQVSCSRACYRALCSQRTGLKHPANRLEPVICFHCRQTCLKAPWQIKRHERIFCDKACYEAWRHAESQVEERPCAVCGIRKRFDVSKLHRNEAFLCSVACRGKWQSQTRIGPAHQNWKGPLMLECTGCGRSFERTRARGHRQMRGICRRAFCTEECMFEYMRREQSGEKHPRWKGGRFPYFGPNWYAQRREARERDGGICRDCGKTEAQNGRQLHVHHIQPREEGGSNDLENLVCLCSSCHLKREWALTRAVGATLQTLRRYREERAALSPGALQGGGDGEECPGHSL